GHRPGPARFADGALLPHRPGFFPAEPAMTPIDDLQAVRLRRLLEEGLPLEASPYRLLAERIGATEDQVLAQVQQWQRDGLIRRVGLVLKHRALGIHANAMLELDIPDTEVDALGARLSAAPGVNLCYGRPRR